MSNARNQQRAPRVRRRPEDDLATIGGSGRNTFAPTVFRTQAESQEVEGASLPGPYRMSQAPSISARPFVDQPGQPSPEEKMKGGSVPYVSPYADRRRKLEEENRQLSEKTTESKDSRLRSGAEAAAKTLAEAFSMKYGLVKDWDELVARLGAGVGGFVGGVIHDKWDEEDERLRNLDTNKKQLGDLNTAEDQYYQTRFKASQMENMERDDRARDDRDEQSTKDKEERRKLTLRQQLLGQINLQKSYRKGADPAFDSQLADAGIELQDFDHTKPNITENGVRKAWNPASGKYEQIAGTEVDPEEAPLDVKINGVPTRMSRKEMNRMLFQQGINDTRQDRQDLRQNARLDKGHVPAGAPSNQIELNQRPQVPTQQVDPNKYREAQMQLTTYKATWESNFNRTNGRPPTPEETRAALEQFAITTWGFVPAR